MATRPAIRWVGVWSVHRRETGPRVIDEIHEAKGGACGGGAWSYICAIGACAAQEVW